MNTDHAEYIDAITRLRMLSSGNPQCEEFFDAYAAYDAPSNCIVRRADVTGDRLRRSLAAVQNTVPAAAALRPTTRVAATVGLSLLGQSVPEEHRATFIRNWVRQLAHAFDNVVMEAPGYGVSTGRAACFPLTELQHALLHPSQLLALFERAGRGWCDWLIAAYRLADREVIWVPICETKNPRRWQWIDSLRDADLGLCQAGVVRITRTIELTAEELAPLN